MFQTLSAGNTWQVVEGTGAATSDAAEAGSRPVRIVTMRIFFIEGLSANRAANMTGGARG